MEIDELGISVEEKDLLTMLLNGATCRLEFFCGKNIICG
jgi:hypothetical protein